MAYTFKHGDRPIDDYTIQRAIGRGGFGEVYYAISDGGREVALKYLKENPHVELRGVSHCINLKSPHLVSIFDVKKSSDDEYFIVMEYCSGPSLRDLLIAEPHGFSPEKAAFFTREIAKGLAYLHDRGIVHRDLKPGNIFFDDGYVKIGDYGLSKFISVSRHSAQTASVGTVHYMAPEIGSGSYSKGVDIYALGVMLYEMLCGKVPFEGSSMAEVLMKHLMSQPEVNALTQPFGRVIRKALEKDPKDRYQNVEEMVEELLSGEEIQKSLAGFSAKSLEGAVRLGGKDRLDSPRPSPNPVYPRTPVPGPAVREFKPGSGMPLPDKVARRMDRLGRKFNAQLTKLAARGGGAPVPPPPPGADGIPFAQPLPPRSQTTKRNLLMALLTVGLAVCFGLLIGSTFSLEKDGQSYGSEEAGVGAGFLVVAMLLAVGLGRRASKWFSVDDGPKWAQRLIRACFAAPILALPSIPLFDLGIGLPVWLGLIAVAVFADWNKSFEPNDDGEISFGRVFGTGLGALICTAIAGELFEVRTAHAVGPTENLMFISAGVAAIVSFIVQAGASWAAYQRRWTPGRPAGLGPMRPVAANSPSGGMGKQGEPLTPPHPQTASPVANEFAPRNPQLAMMQEAMQSAMDRARSREPRSQGSVRPRPRAMIVRMFWSLVAFVLMGGMIVTFLIAIMSRESQYHDITAAIIGCVGCGTLMLYALRKTAAFKRPGFWRETVRPFLMTCMMFGIGATITGIAREWRYCDEWATPAGALPTDTKVVRIEREAARAEAERILAEVQSILPQASPALVPHPTEPPRPMALGEFDGLFARDADCLRYSVGEEGRIALVAGLVICSIMLLALTFLTGGKPRPIEGEPAAPFLREAEPAAT